MNAQLKNALIEYTKSSNKELSEDIKQSVNNYFIECSAESKERRIIVAKDMVIQCLYALDQSESNKLEQVLIHITNS